MQQENTEKEIKLSLTRETQARIFPKISADSIEQIVGRLKAAFAFAGFQISGERQVNNVDEYYDTKGRGIYAINSSLRVRHSTNGPKLTVKTPLDRRTGTFTRSEYETSISEDEYARLKRSNFTPIIEGHFRELLDQDVAHTATVHNRRVEMVLNRNSERYKLSVDRIQFMNPTTSAKSDERVEIEIEALGTDAIATLDDIKISLCEMFPEFELSDKTKYEAAIEFVDETSKTILSEVVRVTKKYPVIQALVTLLGILGSIASIYAIIDLFLQD
ncbi:MAG TPA: CYTH domain-containing protein [Ardenticatenaceae bacterium]